MRLVSDLGVKPSDIIFRFKRRTAKSPRKCAYCHGTLSLLVSRHWSLRFCSRHHRDAYVKQELERRDHLKRWLGYLGRVPHGAK